MTDRDPQRFVAILASLLAAAGGVGCSESDSATSDGAGPTSAASAQTGSGGASTGPGGTGGGAGTGTGGGGGGTTLGCGRGGAGSPMPLISRDVPAFSSDGSAAGAANDGAPNTSWGTGATPAWLAYDLSAVPLEQRQHVLVAWYAIHAGCYIDAGSPSSGQRPIDYAIEASDAPGGASPPTSGWTEVLSVTENRYCGRHHLVDLKGASWVRINVTKGSADGSGVALDLDIQSAPDGACDAWLFMGDSITYMTMTYAFSDLPSLVQADKPAYWPAVIDAALGGTNTTTAMSVIDDTMMDFPGRFVTLAYGTNDHANELHMEELVQHVIAAGKVPVVPHMPWSDGSVDGPAINTAIDALYTKYPEIVPGPDLWAFFEGRTDLIPSGDVHPNAQGQEELRKQWAGSMSGLDE